MAMIVVLAANDGGEVQLGRDALLRLGELGVTNISLVHDEATVGVVLEGWAFDPIASGPEAAETVIGTRGGSILLPMMQAAVAQAGRRPDGGH